MTTIEERLQNALSHWANVNSIELFLNERSRRDLGGWFSRIEEACEACGFLEGHYARAAIIFIESHDLAGEMREKQQQYLNRTNHAYWIWDDFKEEIRRTIQGMDNNAPPNHLPLDEVRQRLFSWTLTSRRYPLFKGRSKDLGEWFSIVERACRESQIPPIQRTDAALMLIFQEIDLAEVMRVRQQTYLESAEKAYWDWPDFKQDIRQVVAEAERRESLKFWAASAGVGLMVAGSIVLVPAVGVLILNAVGFTSGGVLAGSLAAAIQSVFYGGATGGIFSILQMIGATAVLPAALDLIVAGAAVGAGLVLRKVLADGTWSNRAITQVLTRLRLITNPT